MDLKLLTIETDTNNILKSTTTKVTDPKSELETLATMTEIMLDNNGLGLTSTQVGLTKSMFVAYLQGNITYCINPKILKVKPKKITDTEGCLSVPGVNATVARYQEIFVTYHDGHKPVTKWLKGLSARVFQHEYDHLKGKCICWSEAA